MNAIWTLKRVLPKLYMSFYLNMSCCIFCTQLRFLYGRTCHSCFLSIETINWKRVGYVSSFEGRNQCTVLWYAHSTRWGLSMVNHAPHYCHLRSLRCSLLGCDNHPRVGGALITFRTATLHEKALLLIWFESNFVAGDRYSHIHKVSQPHISWQLI
jgi:hypothetical protein